MKLHALISSLAIAASVALACNDPSDDLTGRRNGPAGEDPMDPGLQALYDQVKSGAPMVRNLSNQEYLNAISDLIGFRLSAELQKSWTATTQFSGFDAVPWTNMDAKAVRDRMESLEAILDQALAAPKVMTCNVAAADGLPYQGCAKTILEPFATRAFGRPLTVPEALSLAKTYEDGVALAKTALGEPGAIFADGVRAALGSILLAPQFITRVELPPAPEFNGERDLGPYEVASRLSFMLLGTIPDDELWAKAQDGTLLSDPTALRTQVNRLLETKVDVFVQTFMGQWFDFRAYENAAPDSTEHAMWNETWRTLADVVKRDLPISAIVKPGFTYLNDTMAAHYGIAEPFAHEFRMIPTEERGGILQQGSWLTLSASPLKTSPMHRGRLVQDRLLCKVIPPPDSALFAQIQAVSASIPETATVKERLEMHRKAGEACFGCHQYMDPIGLGLEGFDQFGKTRTVYADTNHRVETDSNIVGKPFATAAELNRILSAMPEYERCASEKLAMFSLKRVVDGVRKEDAELLNYLSYELDGKAPSIREIILRLVKSKAFMKVNHGARN